MTLSEFLNGYSGFVDNQKWEQQRAWERSRFILQGLVKNPPRFPWEKEDTRPYTEEEKKEIAEYHDKISKEHGKKQILTNEGWVDVNT